MAARRPARAELTTGELPGPSAALPPDVAVAAAGDFQPSAGETPSTVTPARRSVGLAEAVEVSPRAVDPAERKGPPPESADVMALAGDAGPYPSRDDLDFALPPAPTIASATLGNAAEPVVIAVPEAARYRALTEEQRAEATKALEDVYRSLYAAIRTADSPLVEQELAAFVPLLPDLPRLGDPYVFYQADLAIRSIAKRDQFVGVARSIRKDLARRIRAERRARWPAAVWLLAGLFLFLYVPLLAAGLLSLGATGQSGAVREVAGIPLDTLLWVAISGSLGAIVSIMVRIDRFNRQVLFGHRIVLIATGFFKPFIGAAFGAFLFVAVTGEIVPITIPSQSQGPFFMAMAFLAGFSERLVPDIAQGLSERYGQVFIADGAASNPNA